MRAYDGVPADELARRVHTSELVIEARVESTLDVVHAMAERGAPAGTLVLAEEQLAGRGRHGRAWHSPPGQGIWLGWLMRPAASPATGVTALRAGLALAGALEALGGAPRLKWPNDVLLEGRKVAGILCEARWHAERVAWIAVGIGVNVYGPLGAELARTAIAVDEVLPGRRRTDVLTALMSRLAGMPQGPCLTADERDRYHQYDWLNGRTLREPAAGRACGIDGTGALLVETAAGVRRILGGTVVTA